MDDSVKKTADIGARGAVDRLEKRLDSATDEFKQEAAKKIDGLAGQIRELGAKLDRHDEAHAVARRLERSSDYLSYRPSSRIAADSWETVRENRLLWVGAGVVVGCLAYRMLSKR